jgi:hypothetical protein
VREFAEAYKQSPEGRRQAEALVDPFVPTDHSDSALAWTKYALTGNIWCGNCKAVASCQQHTWTMMQGKRSIRTMASVPVHAGWQAFKACLRRECILTDRYQFLYKFRTCQVLIMATVTGTVFLRTRQAPTSLLSGQNYMSVCFYSVMVLFFNGQTELTIAVRLSSSISWKVFP